MRYSGGKSRIAKRLSEVMLPVAEAEGLDTYVEPFVGGGAMGAVMGKHFDHAHYSDVHEDLILMWQALHRGDEFPDEVSGNEYQALKNAEPSAFRGLVGFGASFGGKWFGGYARGNSENYLGQSLRSATRGIEGMRGKETTRILQGSYTSVTPGPGTLIYADPPYKGTLGYGFEFDHGDFWRTVAKWSILGAHVFVSEYGGPFWLDTVLEIPLYSRLRQGSDGKRKATEKLFHVPPLTAD